MKQTELHRIGKVSIGVLDDSNFYVCLMKKVDKKGAKMEGEEYEADKTYHSKLSWALMHACKLLTNRQAKTLQEYVACQEVFVNQLRSLFELPPVVFAELINATGKEMVEVKTEDNPTDPF